MGALFSFKKDKEQSSHDAVNERIHTTLTMSHENEDKDYIQFDWGPFKEDVNLKTLLY
jgi:hypothetical protein